PVKSAAAEQRDAPSTTPVASSTPSTTPVASSTPSTTSAATDTDGSSEVPILGTVSALHLGGTHTCFVASDGSAYCWGGNDSGQVGDGSRTRRGSPVRVEMRRPVAVLDAGMKHSCSIDTTGRAWWWGA